MEAFLGPLLPLFERERAAGRALALGMLVQTAGSTYRKAGALMLIAADGEYSGLLSGGCLESDLREHARTVIASGEPRAVRSEIERGALRSDLDPKLLVLSVVSLAVFPFLGFPMTSRVFGVSNDEEFVTRFLRHTQALLACGVAAGGRPP